MFFRFDHIYKCVACFLFSFFINFFVCSLLNNSASSLVLSSLFPPFFIYLGLLGYFFWRHTADYGLQGLRLVNSNTQQTYRIFWLGRNGRKELLLTGCPQHHHRLELCHDTRAIRICRLLLTVDVIAPCVQYTWSLGRLADMMHARTWTSGEVVWPWAWGGHGRWAQLCGL